MNKTLQTVRIIDIIVVAPYLIMLSENKKLNDYERAALKVLGVGTLVFNLANYIKDQKTIINN